MREIPVIMYHSIRPAPNPGWVFSHLTLQLIYFEMQLEYLRLKKYYVASLNEVINYKRGIYKLPEKSVCITFDDGYLDNWIFAYPLLAKYGYRATIFVAPEFVVDSEEIRTNAYNAILKGGELKRMPFNEGFLTWGELRSMQNTGLIDIQSHTMTHSYYPVSDEIIDFHHPRDSYIWMTWNTKLTEKPFYMTIGLSDAIPLGAPVYRFDKAVVARRVQEDGVLTDYLGKYVESHGGATYFSGPDWRGELFAVAAQFRKMHPVRYERETKLDYRRRLKYEIEGSKQVIEDKLGKPVRVLCWPNGGWNDKTHALALESGYEATTAKGSPNVFNSTDPTRILRMGLHQVG